MYAGLTEVERDADRRQRLLAAALELFGSDGYAAVSAARLCRAAAVTGRDLYRQFGGREGVLVELLHELTGEAVEGVVQSLPAGRATLDAQLRAGVAAYVRYLSEDPHRLRVLWIECVGVSAAVDAARRQSHERFAELLRDRLDARKQPSAAALKRGWTRYARLRLDLVVVATHTLLEGWFRLDRPTPIERVIDDVVAIALTIAELPAA